MSEVRDEHDPDRVGRNGRQSFECLKGAGTRKSAKQSNEAILL